MFGHHHHTAAAAPGSGQGYGDNLSPSYTGTTFRPSHDGGRANPEHGGTTTGTAFGTGNPWARPTFRQWLRAYWVDLLTMAVMGAIGLGVYEAHPAPSRSFPLTFQDGEVVYPEFAYPLRREIVPIWLAAFLGSVVPIVFFLLFQIRVRSFADVNAAILGLLNSLITAAVFQVFLKWLIGGLRPHFLAVCQPSVAPGTLTGNGYLNIMYDRSVCTGDQDEIDDSLESFPSGHSTAAFAGFVFLSLYFNAKLKCFANYRPGYWKQILFFAPLLGATLIAGSLTIDQFHNWYDVLAGAVIGTATAFAAFRMSYCAVWDWRCNHVPLPREGLDWGSLYAGEGMGMGMGAGAGAGMREGVMQKDESHDILLRGRHNRNF
ncbi:PAP2-domain-containing protein [Calocera cornea HHB12733]|uniref:PAP2-domain-containing protein n=1 Tax=Calocera cornea HHB12733 TaxID=1353952 RepID=A0A165IYI0_9BASI|nr:PAP2-domain-containing protein [Calocera cornea HHB12733]